MNSQNEKDHCKKILDKIFPNSKIRITYGAGGFLIEVIRSDLVSEKFGQWHHRAFAEIVEYNKKEKQKIFIHKLFLYPDEQKKYQVRALLHTRSSEYVNGMHTSYLGVDDAMVWMTELDSQSFAYHVDLPLELTVFDDKQNDSPFCMKEGVNYKEIIFDGRYLPLKSIKKTSNDFWNLTVG